MKIKLLLAAALLGTAAPSAALTFVFAKASGGVTSSAFLNATAGGRTLQATGNRYTVAPTALTNVSQFTGTAAVSQSSSLTVGGVGVNSEQSIGGFPAGAGGNAPEQVDTDGTTNEVLRIALLNPSLGSIRINSVTLSSVDPDDTFRIYTLGAGGALNVIAFGGDIAGTGVNAFTGGTATYLSGSGTNQQWRITFAPFSTPSDVFYLTARKDSADGYRVTSIDASIVPEPATWALLIGGFSMVGLASRRRRISVTA
ncbi:PEPxxWA-CTERM sorting domain-containing protein [Glacieibacterium frigidum]|uniref:PEP-CTERM sorting domain-containing protein n=1 Tax=Glacieibacterium frigidum TaxID=2593303 RepID=A0A552U7Y2_9SPHN|nr:PEPxxWA-CTERM sorting domain-containing protein [Glacieibacterium frigidum]TRW14323.1 PEP-CTERM sorting domain-containing protein [Glacieibacterium frigidum]